MMKQCWMTTRVCKIPRCMLQNVWLYDAEVSSLYSIFDRGSTRLILNLYISRCMSKTICWRVDDVLMGKFSYIVFM
jgi:hypothetical protein